MSRARSRARGARSALAAALGVMVVAACAVPEREFIPDEQFYDSGATGGECEQPECVGCRNCFSRCLCLISSTEQCLDACSAAEQN